MNKSKYFLFYWVQPFKVHTIEKQKLYTKATNYLNCKTANHYIILVLLHSYELHKNAKKKKQMHISCYSRKKITQ
jgi:hypothetical protein